MRGNRVRTSISWNYQVDNQTNSDNTTNLAIGESHEISNSKATPIASFSSYTNLSDSSGRPA